MRDKQHVTTWPGLESRCTLALLLVWGFGGCTTAPEAPQEYEELMSFLFENMENEKDEMLVAGTENLALWLEDPDNLGKSLGGFLFNKSLSEEAVDSLDEKDRKGTGLVGMSFSVKSPHHVDDLSKTLAWEDFTLALPHLELYERTFLPEGVDPSCLASKECHFLEAQTRVRADWGGLGIMETREHVQFRWVESDAGWVLLHRTWLREATSLDNTLFDVSIRESYKISVNVNNDGVSGAELKKGVAKIAGSLQGNGEESMLGLQNTLCGKGTLRVEARWMDATFSVLSDKEALDLSMGTAKKDATNLDAFMEERFDEVPPATPLIYGVTEDCNPTKVEDPVEGEEDSGQSEQEGLAPCPLDEGPCEVVPPETFGPAFIFSALQVSTESRDETGFNVDPEQGGEDCAPVGICEGGIDNNLSFLAALGNEGLTNAILADNLNILGTFDPEEDGTGTIQFYLGQPASGICALETQTCVYRPSIESWGCDCSLLASMKGTVTNNVLEAGGDDARFALSFPIDDAQLPITTLRTRLRAKFLQNENGIVLSEVVIGGAVRVDVLLETLSEYPGDTIGPLTKEGILTIIESIPADIDTDEDGIDDALSIGLSAEALPIQLLWDIPVAE